MGFTTELDVLRQLKKGQGETNERLELLIEEQRRVIELLEAVLTTFGNQMQRGA